MSIYYKILAYLKLLKIDDKVLGLLDTASLGF